MKEKNYKLILLGIAEEFNEDEIKEKLSRVFQKSLKQIDKLLKKPSVLRAKVNYKTALQYQNGLERIGALCHIEDDKGVVVDMNSVEELSPDATEEEELQFNPDELIENVILDSSDTLQVIRVRMSFGAMSVFLFKCLLASIPAILLCAVLIFAIMHFLGNTIQSIL
jgi:hypothetical protein